MAARLSGRGMAEMTPVKPVAFDYIGPEMDRKPSRWLSELGEEAEVLSAA